MSDNIPFDIQLEIIKMVSDVKYLVQFRSVSKLWKSFIDSSEFIKGYGARDTQPHSCLLMYKADRVDNELKYVSLVEEDDIETLKAQQDFAPFVVSPLLKRYYVSYVVGSCHGLVCFYGFNLDNYINMILIWNPAIGKSFGLHVPRYDRENDTEAVYGFGVCPVTSDPTIVKVECLLNKVWHVEVFTLSSGVWNVLPDSNLPHKSIVSMSSQVVIDRFIYWGATDSNIDDYGNYTTRNMVLSFDLITKGFKVVDLPDNLTNELLISLHVSVSKLRGSLVVFGYIVPNGSCGVWVMERDSSSFTKLFSFGTLSSKILGFRKNGETIFESQNEDDMFFDPSHLIKSTLHVYNPSSQQIKNVEISAVAGRFFMDSYKKSLLLLDHPELHII